MCCTPKSCMRNRNNFKEHFDIILFRKFCATRCSNSSVRRTMLSLHFFETCRILDQILNQTQIQVNFVSTGNYFRSFFSTKNKTSKIINLCVFETINQIGIINGAKYEAKKSLISHLWFYLIEINWSITDLTFKTFLRFLSPHITCKGSRFVL